MQVSGVDYVSGGGGIAHLCAVVDPALLLGGLVSKSVMWNARNWGCWEAD